MALEQYVAIQEALAEAERAHPEVALQLERAVGTAALNQAQARVVELEAQVDELTMRLHVRASLDRDKMRILWHQRGELAALRGTAPALVPARAPHEASSRLAFVAEHPVAEVVGRVTQLRPLSDGRVLTGRCPLCVDEGLHVHPDEHTWGCRSCGRFGDAWSFITQYREAHGVGGPGHAA